MKLIELTIALIILTANTGVSYSSDVLMAFGERIPPFCFPETDSGIELEVIGEALGYRGHRLIPQYLPLARIPLSFRQGLVDAVMTDLGEDLSVAGGHYGDPAVWYDNVFITLKDRNIEIDSPEDLKGLSVVSFQGAVKRYPQWLGPVKNAGNYTEITDQSLQVLTLDRGRYDAVLSDRHIFRYYTAELKKKKGLSLKPVREHEFTTPDLGDYRPVFRNKSIRDDFNAGLKHLKESGRYQEIYDKYLK